MVVIWALVSLAFCDIVCLMHERVMGTLKQIGNKDVCHQLVAHSFIKDRWDNAPHLCCTLVDEPTNEIQLLCCKRVDRGQRQLRTSHVRCVAVLLGGPQSRLHPLKSQL